MKFVRLTRSEQWTEDEQHDPFCFSLEGAASDNYRDAVFPALSPELSPEAEIKIKGPFLRLGLQNRSPRAIGANTAH